MKIKISILLLGLSLMLDTQGQKRTHDKMQNETNKTQNTSSRTKRNLISTIKNCKCASDYKAALAYVNSLSKEVINILNQIENRLKDRNFDENNLMLDYKFSLFLLLKNNQIEIEKVQEIYDSHKVLELYARSALSPKITSDDLNLGGTNVTALYMATELGHNILAELLIKMGADVDFLYQESSVLYAALDSNNHSLDLIKELISAGADINYQSTDYENETPLIMALRMGKLDVAKYLIAQPNIDVNLTTDYGWTALFHCCELGYTEIVDLLLQNNAMVDIIDNNNLTPLFLTILHDNAEIVELLLLHGATVDNTIDVLPGFIITNPFIHSLENNNELSPKQRKSKISLNIALSGNKAQALEILNRNQIGYHETLNNFYANAYNKDRLTALMVAAISGNIKIVQLLLDYGCDKSLRDRSGKTAYDKAIENGHQEIADLISNYIR